MTQHSSSKSGLDAWRSTAGLLGVAALACGLCALACDTDQGKGNPDSGASGGSTGSGGEASGGSAGSGGTSSSGGGTTPTGGATAAGGQGGEIATGGASGGGGAGGSVADAGRDGGATDGGAADGGPGLPLVTQLATGNGFSCALMATGVVKCWGDDSYGTLGNGPPTIRQPVASEVVGLASVKKIAAAGSTVCAIRGDDSVLCWGFNQHQQLAVDPSVREVTSPVALNGFADTPAKDVTVCFNYNRSTSHGCVIDASGTIGCWARTAPTSSASLRRPPAARC